MLHLVAMFTEPDRVRAQLNPMSRTREIIVQPDNAATTKPCS